MLYKHCRICLTKTFKFSCFSNGENSIKYKMRMCAPEIDLNVISDPVLCDACTKKLDVAYKFKMQCLNIEEKIIDYVKAMQPETLHIKLIDVIRMIIDDPKGKKVSNASVIELSDADDDVNERERNADAISRVNLPEMSTNILEESIETILSNEVTNARTAQYNSQQLHINSLNNTMLDHMPDVEPEPEPIEHKVFLDIGDTCVQTQPLMVPGYSGSSNFGGFGETSAQSYPDRNDTNCGARGNQTENRFINLEVINLDNFSQKGQVTQISNQATTNQNEVLKNRMQRKYNDVFQKRITNFVEQNLLMTKDTSVETRNRHEASTRNSTNVNKESDDVIVIDDVTPGTSTFAGNTGRYSQGRTGRYSWRNNMQNSQPQQASSVKSSNTSNTNSKENVSRQVSDADKNKTKGHVLKDGGIIKKPFGCTKCSETFETIDRLLKHVREHKTTTVHNYSRNRVTVINKNS